MKYGQIWGMPFLGLANGTITYNFLCSFFLESMKIDYIPSPNPPVKNPTLPLDLFTLKVSSFAEFLSYLVLITLAAKTGFCF